ncbi:MAG: hypothetical protein JKY20_04640 [Alphaproteobacteria bacterium]|nr:hypothetical protein [Alphaproteobacteria bacterium]
MEFEDAAKLLMASFNSTIKANLPVGLPLDLQKYNKDSLEIRHETVRGQGFLLSGKLVRMGRRHQANLYAVA